MSRRRVGETQLLCCARQPKPGRLSNRVRRGVRAPHRPLTGQRLERQPSAFIDGQHGVLSEPLGLLQTRAPNFISKETEVRARTRIPEPASKNGYIVVARPPRRCKLTQMEQLESQGLGNAAHGFRIWKPRAQRRPKPRRGTLPTEELDAPQYARLLELAAEFARAVADAERFEGEGKGALVAEAHEAQRRIQISIAEIMKCARVIGEAPVRAVPVTRPAARLAAYLLARRWSGAGGQQPTLMGNDEQEAILRCFISVFGVPVEKSWILPFTDQVQRACLERLNAGHREAHLDAERQRELQDFAPQATLMEHGEQILRRVQDEIALWPLRPKVPSWLDASLTAYLTARYGFENGGGPGRTISRKTLAKLLANPRALAGDLKKGPDGKNRFRVTLEQLKGSRAGRRGARNAQKP